MENSIYVGLSRQVVLQENMQIVANNVANMTTPGFRGQNMVFTEYVEKPRGQEEPISLVLDYGQYQKTDAGPMSQTGNPLDAALVGPGFFGIQTPNGIQYTRGGNFALNANGEIVTSRGLQVASAGGGGPIIVPPDSNNIYIDENGRVSTDDGEVGQIMIVEFESEQILNPAGNGLYETEDPGRPAENTRLRQGLLEGSNVESVVEMTRMIDILREYQAVQNMMRTEHDRLRTAIQRLSRTNGN